MTDKELAEAYQNACIDNLELEILGIRKVVKGYDVTDEATCLMLECFMRFVEAHRDPDKQKKIEQMQEKLKRLNR